MGRLLDENDVVDALEKVASFFPYRIPGKGETYDKYNEAWNDAIGRAEMEIESLPSTQPESCDGCQWEYAFGYGECHHCKRNFNDMYERGEQDAEIR